MCTDGIGGLPWMDAPNLSGMRRKTYRLNRAQGETTTRIRVGHIIPLCVTTNHFKTCLWPIMFALTQAWPRIVHRVCTRSFSPHLFLTYWEWMKTFFPMPKEQKRQCTPTAFTTLDPNFYILLWRNYQFRRWVRQEPLKNVF